jgi:hypothetical protein
MRPPWFDTRSLRSQAQHDHEVQLCAFDILAEGGDDLRKLPLSMHKPPRTYHSLRWRRRWRLCLDYKEIAE